MNKWVWVGLGSATAAGTGLYLAYRQQTSLVELYDYPITKPPAKVSVIIPALNEAPFIEATLQGLLGQNVVHAYPQMFEIIVVDNESTDNTIEVAGKYATVISAPRGQLNATYAGAQHASGDILVFVDADSLVKPNYLNLLLKAFQDPRVVAVRGSIQYVDEGILQAVWMTISNLTFMQWYGGASAVRKDAFFTVGGHSCGLDVDQMNHQRLIDVGETLFASKLQELGTVVTVPEATMWATDRRSKCTSCAYMNDSKYCQYCTDLKNRQRY